MFRNHRSPARIASLVLWFASTIALEAATVTLMPSPGTAAGDVVVVRVVDASPPVDNDCDFDGVASAGEGTNCNGNSLPDVVVWMVSEAEPEGEPLVIDCISLDGLNCLGIGDIFVGTIPYSTRFDQPTPPTEPLCPTFYRSLLVRRNGTALPRVRAIYHDGATPVEASAEVSVSQGAVVLREYRLDDVPWGGDGDIFADTSEIVNLFVTVDNKTGHDLTNLTARIFTESDTITCVLDNEISLGNLAAGQSLEGAEPFVFRVGDDVQRDGLMLWYGPTARFNVTFQADEIDMSDRPQEVLLELDYDVVNGQGPGEFAEDFEEASLTESRFNELPMDESMASNAASDGFRCQASDRLDDDTVIEANQPCWLGHTNASLNTFDWHIHDETSPDDGRAYNGDQSLHFGRHRDPVDPDHDTTGLSQLDAVVTDPIYLAADPTTIPVLSFKQQVSFVDHRVYAIPGGESVDRGIVQVQVLGQADTPFSAWENVQPFYNRYDVQGTVSAEWFDQCLFDPPDDGYNEYQLYSPEHVDPFAIRGPSSTCSHQFVFGHQGDLARVPASPTSIGRASEPNSGLAGSIDLGTWVETRFNLQRYKGRRIRIRFLATTAKLYDGTDHEDHIASGAVAVGSPVDDGWYIDEVRLTHTVETPSVITADIDTPPNTPQCFLDCNIVPDVQIDYDPVLMRASISAAGTQAVGCTDGILGYEFWKDNGNQELDESQDTLLRGWTDNPYVEATASGYEVFHVRISCSTAPCCTEDWLGWVGQSPGEGTNVTLDTQQAVPVGSISIFYSPASCASDHNLLWSDDCQTWTGKLCGIGDSGHYLGPDPCPAPTLCCYRVVGSEPRPKADIEGPYGGSIAPHPACAAVQGLDPCQ